MKKTITLLILLTLFLSAYVIPEEHKIPVVGASMNDWNQKSFWYYPWGKNRVHKGIDIFAEAGSPVVAPTRGFVLFAGKISMGGNVVYMLGPKWRFHYFAHLQENKDRRLGFVNAGQKLGRVGSTGNAQGKQPHLHYSIKSLFPRLWKYDSKTVNAWDKLFFIDPGKYLITGVNQ